MKRFFLKIFAFLLLLVVLDFLTGECCQFLMSRAGGKTGRLTMMADSLDADILIFGSSRALHHYAPTIIEDSLGMSCYNCGISGNGIICNYGLYCLIASRHIPKVIVYDIEPSYDFALEKDNTRYLSNLKRFYDRPGIDSIFWAVEDVSRFKMMSQMHRYNSDFVKMLSDCVHPLQSYQSGYDPKHGLLQYEPDPKPDTPLEVDSQKLVFWHKLIADCRRNGTLLVFSHSPKYKATSEHSFIADFARKENIPYLSHYSDTTFTHNRQFFEDPVHMNESGATAYTQSIIAEVRNASTGAH